MGLSVIFSLLLAGLVCSANAVAGPGEHGKVFTPTKTASDACTEHNEVIPYPGDCHRYFMCVEQEGGGFAVNEYSCGDWVFDPNVSSCVDPDLPGNEHLCDI